MNRPMTMFIAALALGSLAGCAGMPSSAKQQSQRAIDVGSGVTADAVDAMVKVFPPALTPLLVKQSANDAFGRRLLDGLRERGYAVTEAEARSSKVPADQGVPFTYRMAPIVDSGMYELVLIVGDVRLSRLYMFDVASDRVYPGGEWSRRE